MAWHLKLITDLIQADFGPRVYYAIQSGYDTHSDQLQDHARLLSTLGRTVKAFVDDLAANGQAERVVLMCFSEFGRQVEENASAGTDHGTAGPMFLAGAPVRVGLHGRAPDLTKLEGNAPHHTTDFRSVYGSLLRDWLGVEPAAVLGDVPGVLNLISG